MSVKCTNCQADNADGDRFCRSCGQTLPAIAEAPAPSPAPGPGGPSGSSPSQPSDVPATAPPATPAAPAQAPALGAPPPVPATATPVTPPPAPPGPASAAGTGHRLPVALIVGGAASALLLAAVVGVVVAIASNGDDDGGGTGIASIEPLPSGAAEPTPVESRPAAASPSPTPAGATITPVPVETASPSPSAGGGDGSGTTQVIDVETIRFEVPGNWRVLSQDRAEIWVQDPVTGGIAGLRSDTLTTAVTLSVVQQAVVARIRADFPDAEVCAEPEPSRVPGGPEDGVFFALCYTLTPSGGEAIPVADVYIIGIQGQAFFYTNVFAKREQIDAFVQAMNQLPAPVWKLYSP
jgi:hypothetical protein